jgi:hypothetical protein
MRQRDQTDGYVHGRRLDALERVTHRTDRVLPASKPVTKRACCFPGRKLSLPYTDAAALRPQSSVVLNWNMIPSNSEKYKPSDEICHTVTYISMLHSFSKYTELNIPLSPGAAFKFDLVRGQLTHRTAHGALQSPPSTYPHVPWTHRPRKLRPHVGESSN